MADGHSVDELADLYLAHLRERHPEAWMANNLDRTVGALRELRDMYGPEPASEFGPKKLKDVRRRMLDSGRLNRETINTRIRICASAFAFGVSEELLPGDLAHALGAVKPLGRGEYGAREGGERPPVPWEDVDAALDHMPRLVRALVLLLWWTGARPSELLELRPCDVERSGDDWRLDLRKHKTAAKGKRRTIFFGPEARRVLQPFLIDRAADRHCFRPAEAVREMYERRAEGRKIPRWPSHARRYARERAERPRRKHRETYDSTTLRQAVARAIAAANRDRKAKGIEPVTRWTPYQLRHACATRLRKDHGLETVRALLSHSSASMTEVYAEVDAETARAIMEKSG